MDAMAQSLCGIGYKAGGPEIVRYLEAPTVDVVNLASSATRGAREFSDSLQQAEMRISAGAAPLLSYVPVNEGIRGHLAAGNQIDYDEYDEVRTLSTRFYSHFRDFPRCKTWIYDGQRLLSSLHDAMYLRFGNVELRVLETWLRAPDRLAEAERRIRAHLDDDDYIYGPSSRPHWLSAEDADFNLRRLLTNAGFYSARAGRRDHSLEDWCERYFQALKEADFLFAYPDAFPNFYIVQEAQHRQNGRLPEIVHFPDSPRFYRLLAGETVAFVTPFYREIRDLYASGRIFDLYTDIDIPEFELTTIQAHISTYPNRPHGSWSETFTRTCDRITDAFAKKRFSLFLASCGCYGLPISHFVRQQFGVPVVYFGHHVNGLLGVRQSQGKDYIRGNKKLENWATSPLSAVPNMDRIDQGRYT